MARRGTFGRLPRVQQNVTGQLVSLAREMVAREDSNIMDAWKNGETFQGKKATDDIVLAYWKGRMKNLDPGDPLYETYRNQVEQLTYGIEQSKQDLLHVQGKLTDAAYAQFFLKWANKVPKNSEFYRVLQKDAAQLMEAAKARGRASADKARADAFNAFVKSRSGDTGLGNAITDAMDKISKETGLSITGNGDHLLELLSADYRAHPDEYRALQDSLKGTSFDGSFTHEFVANSLDQARSAYSQIATRADKDGYATQYASASKAQGAMSDWGQNLTVWDSATTYARLEDDFVKVWGNANSSWSDRQSAAAKFSVSVNALANTPGIDIGSKTMLQADAKRAMGEDAGDAPSFGQAMLGHAGFTPEMATQVQFYRGADDLMKSSPPGQFVYAATLKDGSFDPDGKGPVGIVQASGLPAGTVMVAVPGLDGAAKMVSVLPRDIKVTDPNNPAADAQTVGKFVTYQSGARTMSLYQYTDAHGQQQWSPTSPLATGTLTSYDKAGNLIATPPSQSNPFDLASKISPSLATQMKAAMDANGGVLPPGSKFSASTYDTTNGARRRITNTFDGTEFTTTTTDQVLDPNTHQVTDGSSTTIKNSINTISNLYSAVMAGSRLSAGNIPGVTFSSVTEASIAASAQTLTGSQMATLAKDPLFQQQFVVQQMKAYNTADALDPRIVSNWEKMTRTATNADSGSLLATGTTGIAKDSVFAGSRPDLSLPGLAKADTSKGDINITFGGKQIVIPNAPLYLQQAPGLVDHYGNTLAGGGMPWLKPLQGPSVTGQPLGGPAPITPTPTTTGAAPTPLPTPTTTLPAPIKPPTGPATPPSGYLPGQHGK